MNEIPAGTNRALFSVFTKGTQSEGQEVRRSANWAVAHRGWLRFFADRLELGDWRVPYADIHHATFFRLKTLLGGYVLRVNANNQTYQFGINPWALAGKRLPFPHEQQETHVRHTLLSVILRLVLLAWLLVWAFEKLRA